MKKRDVKDMDFLELRILCMSRGIPCKDASSADELRKRLIPKKSGGD